MIFYSGEVKFFNRLFYLLNLTNHQRSISLRCAVQSAGATTECHRWTRPLSTGRCDLPPIHVVAARHFYGLFENLEAFEKITYSPKNVKSGQRRTFPARSPLPWPSY